MPYRYVEGITRADVAVEAWGATPEEMFAAAAEGTMHVMVQNLDSIEKRRKRAIMVQDTALDLLLVRYLQEFIYYKDAQRLLLRPGKIAITSAGGGFTLRGQGWGETIDRQKHELLVDVKAATLHHLHVEQSQGRWRAIVVLDV